MSDSSYLVIPVPETHDGYVEVGVRFKKEPPQMSSWVKHWIDGGFVNCDGIHCLYCLDAQRVTQRFETIVVDDEGNEKVLAMNLGLYQQVVHRWKQYHLDFLRRRWVIRRTGQAMKTGYEVFPQRLKSAL